MFKKLNMFALTLLILGQTILGPIGVSTVAFADEPEEEPEAQAASEETVEKAELKTLLEKSYDASEYEENSFAAYVQAITDGQKVYDNSDATQEDVNKAVDAIKHAVNALKQKTPTEEPEEDDEGLSVGHDGSGGALGEYEGKSESEDEPITEGTEPKGEIDSESSESDNEWVPLNGMLDNSLATVPNGLDTGFSFTLDKVLDGNQNQITEDNPLDINIDLFFISYTWKLANSHTYKANDSVSFNLPPQLNVWQELKDALKDEDTGIVFGNYTVNTSGTITITFTEAVEELSNITGDVWLASRLDESKIEVTDGNITIGPLEDGSTLTVPIQMDNLGATISKSGTPKPAFSPTEIEWTVTVNAGIVNQTSGFVTDTLPDGLTYKSGTTKVDGTGVSDPSISGSVLTFNLGNFKGQKTITFTTEIDPAHFAKQDFTNNASYEADNNTKIDAQASSVSITRGKPLEKLQGNYNSNTREITWKVNINFDGQSVGVQNLVDSWAAEAKMQLIPESVQLQKVKLDDNGNPSNDGTAITLTPSNSNNTGFTVGIPAITEPHVLTYKTKLDERVLHGQGGSIGNTVTWNGETAGNSASASPNLGSKSYSDVNYTTQTVKWTLVYNQDKQSMTNTVIEDTLTEGLTLVGGVGGIDVSVSDVDEDKIDVDYDEISKKIKVKVNGKTEKQITVTYTTTFDYKALTGAKTGFDNAATIKWTDEFSNEQTDSSTLTRTFTPNDETQGDGTKSGTYNSATKEITWTVTANYQRNDYAKLVINDQPQGNQKLVTNSIKVYEATVQPGGEVEPVGDPIDDVTPEIVGNDFTVTLENTNKTYQIVYKTTLEGLSDIASNYGNKAYVSESGVDPTEIPGSIGITNGGSYASKTGEQNGNVMDWQVIVNATQATIKNVVLTDTLSANQEFLENSIKVYATEPGTTTKLGNPLTVDDFYSFKISDDTPQKLTLEILGGIDRTFIVEYSTLFFAGHNEDVSNSYKITATGVEGDKNQSDSVTRTIQQLTGGSGQGTAGYLKVKKIANDDPDKIFEGVTFNLIDPLSGTVLRTGTTDEDGMIDFKRLKFGTYELEEVADTTPEGYATPLQNFKVEINQEYDPADPDSIQIEELINEKIRQGFEFTKVDADDNSIVLEGVEFELQKDDGTVVEPKLISGTTGKISANNLDAGDYKLIEKIAPVGYVLDDTPIEFTIVEGQTEPTNLGTKNGVAIINGEITNAKGKDAKIIVTKVDAERDAEGNLILLDGAVFNLVDSTGTVIDTKTTGVNGIVEFDGLDYGQYTIEEATAPVGYVNASLVDDEEVLVDKTEVGVTFENTKVDRSVKLTKVAANNHSTLLENAEFKLMKAVDPNVPDEELVYEEVTTLDVTDLITDEDGEIYLEGLDTGKYQFIETKAPSGYRLDATPVEFKIEENQTETVEIVKENRRNSSGGGWTPPTDPEEPGEPTDPENPDPEEPGEPTDPENPDPEEPGDPTDPENPDPEEPGDPTDPENPDPEEPGEPTDPENPDPEEPGKPTDPENPDGGDSGTPGGDRPGEGGNANTPGGGKPGTGGDSNPPGGSNKPGKGDPNAPGTGNKLPQTGEEHYMYMIALGTILLAAGAFVLYRPRRKA